MESIIIAAVVSGIAGLGTLFTFGLIKRMRPMDLKGELFVGAFAGVGLFFLSIFAVYSAGMVWIAYLVLLPAAAATPIVNRRLAAFGRRRLMRIAVVAALVPPTIVGFWYCLILLSSHL